VEGADRRLAGHAADARDSKDTAPCFRHDGALCFLSNRQPNEVKADEDADKRMQVWCLPAEGGEPAMLTDEPLGVEGFRCARGADRMVLFAPVLPDVPHEKQRETAAERKKKGPSARRYGRQPVRHWTTGCTRTRTSPSPTSSPATPADATAST